MELHKKCTPECPKFPPTIPPNATAAVTAVDRMDTDKTRALLVMAPSFVKPTTLEEAKGGTQMFPLNYSHVMNADEEESDDDEGEGDDTQEKKDLRWIREIRSNTEACSYDDKEEKILYVEEWVSDEVL